MDGTIILNGILCDYRTRKPILTTDDSIATIAIDSVVNANISVMDAAPAPLDPRAAYIASLSAPKQQESVLTQAYRERNQRAALGGLMPYVPDSGGSPEN